MMGRDLVGGIITAAVHDLIVVELLDGRTAEITPIMEKTGEVTALARLKFEEGEQDGG